MAHLQLRRKGSGERVLPVYYSDNYISLLPGESRSAGIEADLADLHDDKPLVVIDGWNIDVVPVFSDGCEVEANTQALVSSWPVTGLPIERSSPPE